MPEQHLTTFKGLQENTALKITKFTTSGIQTKATKKQENMTHNQEENQSQK